MAQFECDLIVLAGGASRRMGVEKALLETRDGTSLLRHSIERLSGLVEGQTIVVADDPSLASRANRPSHVQQVADDYPDGGALGGLATGLARCSGWAIAVACDMPLVDPNLFAALAALTEGAGGPWDAVVPESGCRPQPLHALYHRRCLPAIEDLLQRGGQRFVEFYDAVGVRYVDESWLRDIDPELHSFVNVNTPEDWQRALALMERDPIECR